MNITLWRATGDDQPHFGSGSFWTNSRTHAEHYVGMSGFGGDALWRLDATIDPATLLDLRPDPWPRLLAATGIDQADYPEGILGHDLLQDVRSSITAAGFVWVTFRPFGFDRLERRPAGTAEEWWYLGAPTLDPVRVP